MGIRDIRDHVTAATDASDGTYDIDAIVTEIGETYGYDIDPATIDAAEYWAIVGKHATDEYTALIGTTATTVAGDHCDVEVTKEVGGSPAFKADLPVRVDDDDKLAKVEGAADEALEAAGWQRITGWEYEDDGLRATVTRA